MKRDLEYRYERKFLIKTVSYDWVIHSIKMNSALFKPLYHSRNINNIYFDNDKLDSFHDNVDGIANRQKVRIRWYGDSKGDVSRPVLEIKNRRNSVGAKLAYPLPPMFIGEDINEREIKKLILESNIPELIKTKIMLLRPKLLNGYTRAYYISMDKKFRITVDRNLYYTKFNLHQNSFKEHIIDKSSTVVELKYHHIDDQFADVIANELGFRLTKNSKYVNGIYALYY
jgi:SPX domain protein involved in polyphosphate accumulation